MISRRDWLRTTALGLGGASLSGWLPRLAAQAAQQQSKAKSCILLWMDGGPPHTDTFDLKPEEPDCGIFKPIDTAVPGIQISELYPQFAKMMKEAAVLRGMSTVENEHLRARVHLRTGYRDGQGGVHYPSIGSVVSRERGDLESPLPNYVAIAQSDRSHGPGYFGAVYQPLFVNDPEKGVENLKTLAPTAQQDRRFGLLDNLEQGFKERYASTIQGDHATVYRRAVGLMRTEKTKAFELDSESARTRDAYGRNKFGQGCLLARRLVEAEVPFVEVSLGGWDTHFENNDAIRKLSAQCDPAMSALVDDLKQRGLLDSTLVVWMGEFGRTPKFKGKGRDHYAKAWSTVLMGAGIKGGQTVGQTDKIGATVVERPISVADFMATICRLMQIDYTKEYDAPGGRPVPLVQKGGRAMPEILR
jgi:hypothetical protein